MKLGCLFGPLLWLFGRNLEQTAKDLPPANSMNEGDVHSGPGGYEDGSYIGGYAQEYFDEES